MKNETKEFDVDANDELDNPQYLIDKKIYTDELAYDAYKEQHDITSEK